MFCSRIISGSSAAKIIQPNIERIARLKRCHMGTTSLSRKARDRYQELRWLARTRPLCKPPWFRTAARFPARRSPTGRATSAGPRRWSWRSVRAAAASRSITPPRTGSPAAFRTDVRAYAGAAVATWEEAGFVNAAGPGRVRPDPAEGLPAREPRYARPGQQVHRARFLTPGPPPGDLPLDRAGRF